MCDKDFRSNGDPDSDPVIHITGIGEVLNLLHGVCHRRGSEKGGIA